MASTTFSSTMPKRAVRSGSCSVVCHAKQDKKIASRAIAGVLAASIAIASPAAFAVDADTLSEGKSVFNSNCAACHLKGNNSVVAERTLKKDAINKYLEGGLKVDAIKYQVQNGKNAMPAWSGRLDDDEIDAVSEYVYAQASGDKW